MLFFARINLTTPLINERICAFANAIFLPNRIAVIPQLHRELRDVIFHIKNFFGPSVLFSILTQFTTAEKKDLDWLYVLNISYWIVIPLFILTVLSNVSGSLITEVSY